ncbi:alpha/beta-hydrolase [Mycena filopes]|nr:alpha/beta-hydrolase [Mycena filopes]
MSKALEMADVPPQTRYRTRPRVAISLLTSLLGYWFLFPNPWFSSTPPPSTTTGSFYHKITRPGGICGNASMVSYSGHIGLAGDTDAAPKRSFFWYFEAENDAANAPVILTMGGGPGTSGMMNGLFGQSACLATADGLVPNPHRWTEKHNLILLDHPIGVGFSYGLRVNDSASAAEDAYDFLQKFFRLFPHLAGNKFAVAGGSYGGVYVPHIATVINERNRQLQVSPRRHTNVHINLDALVVHNPFTSPIAHFKWLLQYRCLEHHIHNATDCKALYSDLPVCLDAIEMAFQHPTTANRVVASKSCYDRMNSKDTHGVVYEDVRRRCIPKDGAADACHPEFGWAETIFNDTDVRRALGVAQNLTYHALNLQVNAEFHAAGDLIQPHHLLYPPLIDSGIRLLHYIGAQDANCPWPGVLSFLKLLETGFQADFLAAADLPWSPTPSNDTDTDTGVTVRSVGPGAGNMAFILLQGAGHFVVKDQPAQAKSIVEHWMANRPFFEKST